MGYNMELEQEIQIKEDISEIKQHLVEVRADLKWVIKNQENHLSHHFRYSIMAWSATAGAILSLIIALITR